MHTVHTRTAQIFTWWAEETGEKEVSNVSYWSPGWCPLLQGISRLCSHPNRAVSLFLSLLYTYLYTLLAYMTIASHARHNVGVISRFGCPQLLTFNAHFSCKTYSPYQVKNGRNASRRYCFLYFRLC